MQVRLKVIGGKNDGREIRIAGNEFIIGRGDEAHLKPSSELVSRRHCSIRIDNQRVIVADEGSRNGTFLNGNQIHEAYTAVAGDILRVGRLQFEIVIDVAQPSDKRPAVSSVADAVARTAAGTRPSSSTDNIDDSISDWLSDDSSEIGRAIQDTTQLSFEDTKAILAEAERKAREKEIARQEGRLSDSSDDGESLTDSKKSKRLPVPKGNAHDSSKGAADDVLRKFFKRR